MDKEVVTKILAAYQLQWVDIAPPQKGYRNESRRVLLADGTVVNLMLFKREPAIVPRIQRANMVSEYLASQGFATRQPHDPRIIRLQAGAYIKYGALYNYLPGQTIPWEAYTAKHIKQLGKTMQQMHQALAGSQLRGPSAAAEYSAISQRMADYFADPHVPRALQTKLGLSINSQIFSQQQQLLARCHSLPGQHMLHMDFVRSNVLFDTQAHITGILDFEKTAYGHPLFDIARTLAFLLVDCKYKTTAQVRQYFLHSGYGRATKHIFTTVRIDQLDLLEELVNLFLFYDFYKFLRHNPYESLVKNEHFVRTQALLRDKNLLR